MQNLIRFPHKGKLELIEMPLPQVDGNTAILKTQLTGISAGTERMWFDGSAPALKSGRKTYPYTPGYELVGIVTADAEGLGLERGDRVFAMKPHGSHAIVGANDIWVKLPDDVSSEDALFIALTGTAVHSIHRSRITIGDTCAVVGLGVLGLTLVEVLTRGMACNVVAVTRSPEKKELAEKRGAYSVISRTGSAFCLPEEWPPVHAAFDTSGTSEGIARALFAISNQGVVVGAGFYTEPFAVDGEMFFTKEASFVSVRSTGAAMKADEFNRWTRETSMALAQKLVLSGTVRGGSLITQRVRPDRAELTEIYQSLAERDQSILQVVVDWEKS